MKSLVLNIPKSHNVSFEKMRFKIFNNLANQSNDGKTLNGFLLYCLCISPYFNKFFEFNYDVIRIKACFANLNFGTFIAKFVLYSLFYQIDNVVWQKNRPQVIMMIFCILFFKSEISEKNLGSGENQKLRDAKLIF